MKEKIILIILSLCLCNIGAWAQEETMDESLSEEISDIQRPTPTILSDSLHLPSLSSYGQIGHIGYYSMPYVGFHDWQLHQGLNVSLGASVFAEFGKHARRGAGFTQSLAAMYAVPLTDKLSVAVGGYLYNVNWQHENFRNAGLNAMINYQFDEHWEGFVYAQKSITHNVPLYGAYYPYGAFRSYYVDPFDVTYMGAADRIGAGVRYHFNPSFSIEVSLEHDWLPNRRFGLSQDFHPIPPPKN